MLHAHLLTELAHTSIDERVRAAAGVRAVPARRRRHGRPRHRFGPAAA
jgi:hypothetical protein